MKTGPWGRFCVSLMVIAFVFDGILDDFQIAAHVLAAPFPAPFGEFFRRIQEAAFGASVFRLFLGQRFGHNDSAGYRGFRAPMIRKSSHAWPK